MIGWHDQFSVLLLNMLPMAVLGAVLGLDMVSFPQIMISRPIVSATLAGAFAGQPGAGLLCGAVLELIALETLPFGASRYAEWGTAGVVGGTVLASQSLTLPGRLPLSLVAALATAFTGSWSMVVVRKINGGMVRAARARISVGDTDAVTSVQLRGLAIDLVRGFVLTLVALMLFLPLAHHLTPFWSVNAVYSRAVAVSIAAMVAIGALWKLFHATAYAGWILLTGVLIGGVALALQ